MMRAVVMRDGQLLVDEVDEPGPDPGQVLLETLACGICGSDLSALAHTEEFLQASLDSGTETFVFDRHQDLVMGHEFCGRVLEVGSGVDHLQPGDVVVALPWVRDVAGTVRTVGYSTGYPGGFAERLVVQAETAVPVPEGTAPTVAALTEPLAVGFGNVAKSGITEGASAVVIGCGPIGLGVVAALAERRITPIVTSDRSALRRRTALALGADIAIDPDRDDVIEQWRHHAEPAQGLVVYNCVGAPGVLNTLLYAVPPGTTIMVVGSCMVDDVIRPVVGVYKDITMTFSMTYPPDEFARTLERIAHGTVDAARLITGEVGLAGVPDAFTALANPDDHVKILVRPDLATSQRPA